MPWAVQLVGVAPNLRSQLPNLFAFPELRISEHPEWGLILESTRFDILTVPAEIAVVARALLKQVKGASRAATGFTPDIKTNHCIDYSLNDEYVPNIHILADETIGIVDEPMVVNENINGVQHISTPFSPIGSWFVLGLSNENIHNALASFSKDMLDYADLYNIYEAVRNDVGNRIFTDGWASQNQINRFTHTINNVQALGEEARHADPNVQPPANPMSFAEARTLIEQLVVSWLCWRELNP